MTTPSFARGVFKYAGLAGILVLVPMYFMEARIGLDFPPAITHPEYYYGFVSLALAWQFAILLISRDPVRYRPLMPITVLEKLAFGIPCLVLFLMGKLALTIAMGGFIDLFLAGLFAVAYSRTPSA